MTDAKIKAIAASLSGQPSGTLPSGAWCCRGLEARRKTNDCKDI